MVNQLLITQSFLSAYRVSMESYSDFCQSFVLGSLSVQSLPSHSL